MSDPYLALPGTKRKRPSRPSRPSNPSSSRGRAPQKDKSTSPKKRRLRDQPSEDDDDDEVGAGAIDSDDTIDGDELDESEGSDVEESAAEKRLRLAKAYLEQVRAEVGGEFDAAEVDREIISQRLQQDIAETKGKVYKHIATSLSLTSPPKRRAIQVKNPVTSVAQYKHNIYIGCKNGIIEKWDISSEIPVRTEQVRRVRDKKVFTGHLDDVLCMAISSDGGRIATGGSDKRICVWNTDTMQHLKTFTQHRGPVMSLACRTLSNQLYSTSSDRTLKLWSLNDLAYIETLFGHQDSIPNVASFNSERCVSVGSRDRSARVWKIVDETQLVYQVPAETKSSKPQIDKDGVVERGEVVPQGSVDCVAVVDEQHFLTGGDNGDIILWSLNKKKPQYLKRHTHDFDPSPLPSQNSAETLPPPVSIPPQPRWITCLTSLPYTDLFFSGSWDGKVGMWRVTEDLRRFELVRWIELGVRGVVNEICVTELGKRGQEGVRLVVGVGKEGRLGRWKTVKGGKNCVIVLEMSRS